MKTLLFFVLIALITFLPPSLFAQCTADAGEDIYLCPGNKNVILDGNGFSASGDLTFQWLTSGTGTFVPDQLTKNGVYTLSAADMAAGVVSLIVRVTDPNTSCQALDTMNVFYGICSPSGSGLITGTVFHDLNSNGVQDPGENGLGNKPVFVTGDAMYYYWTFTDANGYYEMRVANGTAFEITTQLQSYWSFTYPSGPFSHTVTANNDTTTGKSFGLTQAPDIQELSLNIYNWQSRPGFESYYYIQCHNNGSDTLSGTIEFIHDANLIFDHSDPAETSYNPSSHTLTYNYTDFKPENLKGIRVVFQLPVSVPLGTQISSSALINPVAGDMYMDNNYDTIQVDVTGSFDPNDKLAEPIGEGEEHYIRSDDELEYIIRFQNTGTAEAYFVVVEDTLDPALDLSTFEMISSSHPCRLRTDSNRVVKWIFDNIMLPDSTTNEEESHGFIHFRINQRTGNPDGTEIKNKAAIYFDYNYPVITNQTLNTIGDNLILGMKSNNAKSENFNIYPNPAKDIFYIEARAEIINYQIISADGEIINEGNYFGFIDISAIPKGIYFLKVICKDSVLCKKVFINK